jgi:hypothetical protein
VNEPEKPRARLELTVYRNMVPISYPTWVAECEIPVSQLFCSPQPCQSPPVPFKVILRQVVLAEHGWVHASAELVDGYGLRIGELPVKFFYPEHAVPTLLHYPPTDYYDGSSAGNPQRGTVTYSLAIRGLQV